MSNRKIRPGDLDMARPCPKNWNDMQGDDKKRFCKFCKKHVHDVTGMPEDEFRKLMKENDGKACITIIRGSTNTTPSRFNKPIRWLFTATFLFTGIAGFILDKKRLPITEKIFPLFERQVEEERITGDTLYIGDD